MSRQNTEKGKNPAPTPLRSENDVSSTLARKDEASFATRLANSARGLARDVFASSSEDGVGALASVTNGKVVPGPSSSSSSYAAGGAWVSERSVVRAANTTTTTAEAESSSFRTPWLGDSADVQAEFDSFLADDGRDGMSSLAPTDLSTEEMRAEMQELHESWHRGWSRHPGDIERDGNVISNGRGSVEVGDVSVVQTRDGSEVIALLGLDDDDGEMGMGGEYYKEEDLHGEIDDARDVDAEDLFPLASSTTHPHEAGNINANTRPGTNAGLPGTDISYNPTYNFLPFATSQDTSLQDQDLWFRDWERVLTSYADDVWDPSSFPWVKEARESIQQVKETQNTSEENANRGRERALERLRMIVAHIKVPDALVGRQRGGGGGGG